jgi:hypothetical protein
VFYPDNTSFLLPEEQELIDAIAGDVERWLQEITRVYEIRRAAGAGITGRLPDSTGVDKIEAPGGSFPSFLMRC